MILSIDPGSRTTGWVILERRRPGELPALADHGNTPTEDFLEWLRFCRVAHDVAEVVIEHVGHYGTGQAAGSDVFETCILIGRMVEILRLLPVEKVRRQSIKAQLCGVANAKDKNVRQALIDRWGGDELALGGRKCPRCHGKGWRGRARARCGACRGEGWESPPGPLYGVSNHAWSALAAGVYYCEVVCREQR
jgi:Holliday junction resolvasome RuvABC endonuclease subunit